MFVDDLQMFVTLLTVSVTSAWISRSQRKCAKKFCGKRLLESAIILQDLVVDAAIVQSLQAHVKEPFLLGRGQ